MSSPDKPDTTFARPFSRRHLIKAGFGLLATTIISRALHVDAQEEQAAIEESLMTFSQAQHRTLSAIADRIWPPDEDSPGAAEIGAAFYIDRALAGAYNHYADVYHRLLLQFDEQAVLEHGFMFHELGSGQQDAMLTRLENLDPSEDLVAQLEGPEYELGPSSSFDLIRTHVMEGIFSDPIYGGNREFGGWRAVNYPGAQYIYTAEEQQSFEPLDKPMFSVADL